MTAKVAPGNLPACAGAEMSPLAEMAPAPLKLLSGSPPAPRSSSTLFPLSTNSYSGLSFHVRSSEAFPGPTELAEVAESEILLLCPHPTCPYALLSRPSALSLRSTWHIMGVY